MPFKSSNQRMQDTITFIKQHRPNELQRDFNDITHALDAWRAGASLHDRQTLSGYMSQNKTLHRPANPTDRAYRRATILLRCAFTTPSNQWQTKATECNQCTNDFNDWYRYALEAARDAIFTQHAKAQQKLNVLKTNPKKFLRRYKLVVNGQPGAGVQQYRFYMRLGDYQLDCTVPHATALLVRGINVPAVLHDTVQRAQNGAWQVQETSSNVNPPCDLMLTTQFSGCTYCFMKSGNSLVAAHIDPGRGNNRTDAKGLATDLQTNGQFLNGIGGVFKAFGRVQNVNTTFGYPDAAAHTTIVGVKIRQRWQVWAQMLDGVGNITVRRLDS